MEYPEQEIPSHRGPCRALQFSQGFNYLISGADDGTINVRKNNERLEKVFVWNLHDGKFGRISKVCSSFDESYIMSAGKDGNLFIYKITNAPVQPEYGM